jgi:hypothetical protein
VVVPFRILLAQRVWFWSQPTTNLGRQYRSKCTGSCRGGATGAAVTAAAGQAAVRTHACPRWRPAPPGVLAPKQPGAGTGETGEEGRTVVGPRGGGGAPNTARVARAESRGGGGTVATDT